MDQGSASVIAAVIAGVFVLGSAILTFISSRSEPPAAKELRALNELLKDMPEGKGRDALTGRRERVAVRYGTRGATPLSDGLQMGSYGLVLLLFGFLLLELLTGQLPPLMIFGLVLGVIAVFGGFVLVVLGSLVDVVSYIRDRRRRRREAEKSGAIPSPTTGPAPGD